VTTSTLIEPGLYAQVGKRRTSYSTRIGGQYVALGSDLEDARRRLRIALELPPEGDTIESMCLDYLKEQWALLKAKDDVALAEGTIRDYESCLKTKVIPAFGKMRPQDFKPTHSAQYLLGRRKEQRGARANREMAALSSAFNHGMARGMVESNPCRGVRRNKERARTRRVSVAEFNAFLQFAKGLGGSTYLVALVGCIVALTGRRRAEVLGLPRSAMTVEGITVQDAKTKAGEPDRFYLVGWSPLLRQVLTEAGAIPRRVSSIYLFPKEDGQPYHDRGFKSLWNRLMKRWAPLGAQSATWFRAHDLRALYVSEMLDQERAPNTHKNEATMRSVYDRRNVVKVTPLA
jgi:integrase